MATKNLVPRADNEGQLGTINKKWSNIYSYKGTFDELLTSSGEDLIVASPDGDNTLTITKDANTKQLILKSTGGSSLNLVGEAGTIYESDGSGGLQPSTDFNFSFSRLLPTINGEKSIGRSNQRLGELWSNNIYSTDGSFTNSIESSKLKITQTEDPDHFYSLEMNASDPNDIRVELKKYATTDDTIVSDFTKQIAYKTDVDNSTVDLGTSSVNDLSDIKLTLTNDAIPVDHFLVSTLDTDNVVRFLNKNVDDTRSVLGLGETDSVIFGTMLLSSAPNETTLTIVGNSKFADAELADDYLDIDFESGYARIASKGTTTLTTSGLQLGHDASHKTKILGALKLDQIEIDTKLDIVSSDSSVRDVEFGPNINLKVNTPNASRSANSVVPKSYVDALSSGVKPFEEVKAATVGNIIINDALNALDVIDDVTLAEGDRVLVKDQADATENGIYVVGTSPERSSDMASGSTASGSFVFVSEGTVNGKRGFVCISPDNVDVVGTNEIIWSGFSSAGSLTGGVGISVDGNSINAAGKLLDIQNLNANDGGFIVGDGSTFVQESGETARFSLGLGENQDVTHRSISLNETTDRTGGRRSLKIKTPTNLNDSYTLELPESPASADQILKITAANNGVLTSQWANISSLTSDETKTNTTNIETNTADIATNTASIATNTTDIAANTAAIGVNTTAINNNKAQIGNKIDSNSALESLYPTGGADRFLVSNNSEEYAKLDIAQTRSKLGLGTAALNNVGEQANNVVQLDELARLPAVDGSQLTGIVAEAQTELLTDLTPQLGGNLDTNGFTFVKNVNNPNNSALNIASSQLSLNHVSPENPALEVDYTNKPSYENSTLLNKGESAETSILLSVTKIKDGHEFSYIDGQRGGLSNGTIDGNFETNTLQLEAPTGTRFKIGDILLLENYKIINNQGDKYDLSGLYMVHSDIWMHSILRYMNTFYLTAASNRNGVFDIPKVLRGIVRSSHDITKLFDGLRDRNGTIGGTAGIAPFTAETESYLQSNAKVSRVNISFIKKENEIIDGKLRSRLRYYEGSNFGTLRPNPDSWSYLTSFFDRLQDAGISYTDNTQFMIDRTNNQLIVSNRGGIAQQVEGDVSDFVVKELDAGGTTKLLNDSAPQLGGELDTNEKRIKGSSDSTSLVTTIVASNTREADTSNRSSGFDSNQLSANNRHSLEINSSGGGIRLWAANDKNIVLSTHATGSPEDGGFVHVPGKLYLGTSTDAGGEVPTAKTANDVIPKIITLSGELSSSTDDSLELISDDLGKLVLIDASAVTSSTQNSKSLSARIQLPVMLDSSGNLLPHATPGRFLSIVLTPSDSNVEVFTYIVLGGGNDDYSRGARIIGADSGFYLPFRSFSKPDLVGDGVASRAAAVNLYWSGESKKWIPV